ncbi:MAG: CBASS cGAMP-activated phospholipase [Chitinophagaceae bacterium]
MELSKKFRILSIDGGGIRGIIPAKILAELEEYLEQRGAEKHLHKHFDLICGTSTGAILAVGLALGIPAKDLLSFYKTHAKDIFPKWLLNSHMFKGVYRPIYGSKVLLAALEKAYRKSDGSTSLLNDAKTRLCIPTFNGGSGEINVLKTKHHPSYTRDYKIPAHHAAMSSASAPIYFKPHSFSFSNELGEGANINMIDGGVFANNPSLIGLFEATDKLNREFKDIMLLSLGTGKGKHVLRKRWKAPSMRYWLFPNPRAFDIILDSQAQSTEEYMAFLNRSLEKMGSGITYARVQHDFHGNSISLNASKKSDLERLEMAGEELSKKHLSNIAKTFLNL